MVKSKQNGFSLVETIVMAGLLAIIFIPIATLFPTGTLSLKRAENRQTVVYLAKEYLEEAKKLELPVLKSNLLSNLQLDEANKLWVASDVSYSQTKTMNSTPFTITRKIWAIKGSVNYPPTLIDATVIVNYPGAPQAITISTRYYRE